MFIWDYNVDQNWKPKTALEWQWFLVRKINYGEFKGLNAKVIKRYFNKIKKKLDPGKKAMLENYLKQ